MSRFSAIAVLSRQFGLSEEDTIAHLIDSLPHGSGIDYDWQSSVLKNGNVVLSNSFHGMNDGGMYDGNQDFSVILFCHQSDKLHPLCGPCAGQVQVLARAGDVDFKIVNNGGQSRKSWAYGLKDYLYETIGYALSEINIGKTGNEIIQA